MYTELTNEIKGTYTKKDWWIDLFIILVPVILGFGVAVIVFEALGGAEALLTYVESL